MINKRNFMKEKYFLFISTKEIMNFLFLTNTDYTFDPITRDY